MINKVILLGNLGKDPELRVTPTGVQVCQFSLATSEKRREPTTQQLVDHTEWHNIVTFGKTAELCSKYLKKGSQIYLEGKIQTRRWQDQNGQTRYTTEIIANNVKFLSRLSDKPGDDLDKDEEILQALQNADDLDIPNVEDDIPF